jgi:energy-coupling factor transporter ATP-binding protein EcfA2
VTTPNLPLATSTTSLTPLTIEIGGPDSVAYKSINHIVWKDIPPLAVLTGVNGSGKTQLLELLAYKLTNTAHEHHSHIINQMHFTVTGDTFGPDEVAYLSDEWDIKSTTGVGVSELERTKVNLVSNLQSRNSLTISSKRARLERLVGAPLNLAATPIGNVTLNQVLEKLPDDFSFMLEEVDVISGITYVFFAHRLRLMEELERKDLNEEVTTTLPPAPWDVLNETLQAAEFPYRAISPQGTKLEQGYVFRLEDTRTGIPLLPVELSSGEKLILRLFLWLYNSQNHGHFPRLFLLDEPDAHLHPSMARQFMNVIQEVFVDQYKIRVIMTTHSPSTVALAPEGSVFEMSRTAPRISQAKSKAHAIGLLTAGMVIVSPGTRYVLVEDEDDVDFYSAIRDILSDYGPSRDPRAIKPSPSIVFMPASRGRGRGKVGGGMSVVTQWVEKFDQEPLDQLFRGIIDHDTNNTPAPRVYVLSRYNIENYLLDPFVVFGVLLEQGTAPPVPGVSISLGNEHVIRTLSETELQSIASTIRSQVEPLITGLTAGETTPHAVTFTNGKVVEYPRWMIDRNGHHLMPLYQQALGGQNVIYPHRLRRSLQRVRLIPRELADIMEQLQG